MFKNVFVVIVTVLLAGFTVQAQVKTVSPKEFLQHLKEDKSVVLIDVRTPEEVERNHLAGAINVDYNSSDFKKKMAELDKTKTYMVYCGSGIRSGKSVNVMKDLGFKNIFNLDGGIKAWKAEGFPIEEKK